MKLYIAVALIFLLFSTQQCSKKKSPDMSVCVQKKINEIKKEPRWNPPATVNEYLYNGKTVYLFSSDCCDQYNMVYDNQCNYVCAPSGGITGKGDSKCEDFNTTAKHVRLVWKDERWCRTGYFFFNSYFSVVMLKKAPDQERLYYDNIKSRLLY